MWLQKFTCFLVLCTFLQIVVKGDDEICTKFSSDKSIDVTYHCENLSDLTVVDKIPENVTKIIFEDSNLQQIHGNAFFRFGKTLISLDIHDSQVKIIDVNAFAGLHNLQTLILYGNNINYVYAAWFRDLSNLCTLDVSFNSITGLENNIFLPSLKNFYFDGNRISIIDSSIFYKMTNLRRVIMGNNPLIWWNRASLMDFFDINKIDYEDDWEDWKWINAVIWKCKEAMNSIEIYDERILNCAAMKLLTFVNEHLKFQNLTSSYDTRCHPAASRLIKCSRSNSSSKTDDEAVAMSLQEIFHDIKLMEYPEEEFRLH